MKILKLKRKADGSDWEQEQQVDLSGAAATAELAKDGKSASTKYKVLDSSTQAGRENIEEYRKRGWMP